MLIEEVTENVVELVEKLNFAEKVQRSLDLIDQAYQEFGKDMPLGELALRAVLDTAAVVAPAVIRQIGKEVAAVHTAKMLTPYAEKAANAAHRANRLGMRTRGTALSVDAPRLQVAIVESQAADRAFLNKLVSSDLTTEDLVSVVRTAGFPKELAVQIGRTREAATTLQKYLKDPLKSAFQKEEAASVLRESTSQLEELLYPRFKPQVPQATRDYVGVLEERKVELLRERSWLLSKSGRDISEGIRRVESELGYLEVETANAGKLLRAGESPPEITQYRLGFGEGGSPPSGGKPSRPGSGDFRDLSPEVQSYVRGVAERSRLRVLEGELLGKRSSLVKLTPIYAEARILPKIKVSLHMEVGSPISPSFAPTSGSLSGMEAVKSPVAGLSASQEAKSLLPVIRLGPVSGAATPSLVSVPYTEAAEVAVVTGPSPVSKSGLASQLQVQVVGSPITRPTTSPISSPTTTSPLSPPAITLSPIYSPVIFPTTPDPGSILEPKDLPRSEPFPVPSPTPIPAPPFIGTPSLPPVSVPSYGTPEGPGIGQGLSIFELPESTSFWERKIPLRGRKETKKGRKSWFFPGLEISFPDPFTSKRRKVSLVSARQREYGVKVLR